MKTIARVQETAIGGDEDFGSEAAAREAGRKTRYGLARGKASCRRIVVEEDYIRGFLLKGVEPAAIWVEKAVART